MTQLSYSILMQVPTAGAEAIRARSQSAGKTPYMHKSCWAYTHPHKHTPLFNTTHHYSIPVVANMQHAQLSRRSLLGMHRRNAEHDFLLRASYVTT